MRLILPISAIPDNTEVTKVNGNLPLRVMRLIKINGDPETSLLEAKSGTAFLVGQYGSITAVPEHTEVSINGSVEELIEYLRDMQVKEDEANSQ